MPNNSYYETEQDLALDNLISFLGETNYPSHFHKKVEITYMEKGNCLSVINNKNYFAETDDILFISAYHTHSYQTSNDAKRIILCPTDRIIDDFSSLTGNKIFHFLLTNKTFNREKILPRLYELNAVHQDRSLDQASKWLISKGLLNIIYGNFYECYHTLLEDQSKHVESLSKILNYIDLHSAEKLTLDDLAKQFGYSKFYFSRFFNSSIGQSLNTYLNNIRIKNFISSYPKQNNLNIMNLALELGFDSMTSFYRAFKNYCGCTPSEYFATNSEE